MTCSDQRLAGDAGEVCAVTTDLPFFYYGYPLTKAVGRHGRNKSAYTGTDYNHIKVIFTGHSHSPGLSQCPLRKQFRLPLANFDVPY
jgi:hypothetical protein